jgi:bile acid:Na+ symporter, BASS family
MTTDQLNQLINIVASITLFEMMVAIGLGVTVADVLRVATDWRLVAKASLASYVLVPAAAVGLLVFFQADPYVAAGFLICAVCPGAPYGPPFRGRPASSSSFLMVIRSRIDRGGAAAAEGGVSDRTAGVPSLPKR